MDPQEGQGYDSSSREEEKLGFDDVDNELAEKEVNNKNLEKPRRLGWKSVILIIANRMIGMSLSRYTSEI